MLKGNQLWQPSCRYCRGVRREKIGIVATKLPKMGGEKKKKNCGNQVAKNLGRNLICKNKNISKRVGGMK